MRKLKLAACTGLLFLGMSRVQSQSSFPVNGLADPREKCYAFTHATIVQDPSTTIEDAALVIRKGRITALGKNVFHSCRCYCAGL